MTSDSHLNRATGPATFSADPTQVSPTPGQPEREREEKVDRVDQIADHLAHKGAKAEQEFDNENHHPFSK